MDGLNIHGDLLAIIARAEAAGISGSEAATVRLAEAGRDQMREELSGSGHPGGPPGRRTGELARSVKASVTYTETGVRVHVGPTGQREHVGRILNNGWQAHGPVRKPHSGSEHRYPFVPQIAEASRAEAERVCGAEVAVHIRGAGLSRG